MLYGLVVSIGTCSDTLWEAALRSNFVGGVNGEAWRRKAMKVDVPHYLPANMAQTWHEHAANMKWCGRPDG